MLRPVERHREVRNQVMAPLLALVSAVAYGAADFLGGLATRRSTALGALVVSQAAGLAALLLVVPFLPPAHMGAADMAWSVVAGLTGSVGVGLLYHGLAVGPMSVVAPVTAVCAVMVPVAAGLAFGERLSAESAIGIGLAMLSVALMGQGSHHGDGTRGVMALVRSRGFRIAVLSGVAIGGFLVALERTSTEAGMWPLVVSRSTSTLLFGAFALATGRPATVPRPALALALGCGGLDMAANALYLAAVRLGQLSLVATLAALYPASTVVLARVVLGERLSRVQLAGVVCAIMAVVLIVRGSP